MYNDDKEYLNFLLKNNFIISKEPFKNESRMVEQVINLNQDWNQINRQLNDDNIVVINNFLNETYAHRLRNFVLYFNNREDIYDDYAALNFYKEQDLSNRIWFPLLTNIVDESQELISGLHNLQFSRAWAFIYNNQSKGVKPHADPASLSINMWVTPNDCMNMKDGYNGLEIWKTCPPEDWSWKKYNTDDISIANWIENSNAEKINIPYNFNRAVIFNSKMFHKSQQVSSKDGYDNRRINYTFLFNKRINE